MAVMTASECRAYLPQMTGTADDTALDTLIAIADHQLATWCGYPVRAGGTVATFEDVTYTEILDGPGGRDLWLTARPIVSITSIHDDATRDYGSATEVASTDWTLYATEGKLVLTGTASHGEWSAAPQAIKAVYVAGFTTVPAPIKQAVGQLVAHWWRLRQEAGRDSVSQGGGSVGLRTETIPSYILQQLRAYRNPGSYVG